MIKMNEDEKIWLRTKDGQEYFIYKTEKCDMQKELTETINKLQNNWNELKKWLEEYIEATENDYKQTSTEGCKKTQETLIAVAKNFLRKMQEQEGNNE